MARSIAAESRMLTRPKRSRARQQFVRERARGHAFGNRQHADDDRCGQRTALVLRLQSTDDLARQRQRDLRAQREQPVELRLVELHEHRVAHRDDRRGARLSGEEAHLADHLAAADLADHPLGAAFVAHVDAQPATEHQVAGVARLPLLHQHVAARESRPTARARAGTRARPGRCHPAAAPAVQRAAVRGGVQRSSSFLRGLRKGRIVATCGVSARPSPPAVRRTARGRATRAAG